MTIAQIIHLNVSETYLCADLDCRTVSNCSGECPVCHSPVINLAGIVDRIPEKTAE